MNTHLGWFCVFAATAFFPRLEGRAVAAESSPAPVREISADWQQVKGPRSDVFQQCVGAGRAAEGLRAEWQKQLKLCKDEIGFKYIRFHGLLHDDMGVYTEDRNGTAHLNWQYVDQLYDYLLSIGVRPFVEISFMPSALASGSKNIFWWKGNVTPPKDYAKWDNLIEQLTRHWTERYGAAEVWQWYFEVWNEPDYQGFWGPTNPANGRAEYFELYQHTVAAIKKVDPDYRVGGPSGSGTSWIRPLIDYCVSSNLPLDFISFHSYGLASSGGLDADGNQMTRLNRNLLAPSQNINGQRPAIDASPRPNHPIHITEWSASYSSRDPVHDSYFSAPYILAQLKHTEQGIASMSYWTFTDIFEENGPAMTPFHGGFGLLNEMGIKKPAFFAYQFLNRLGPTELQNSDGASWVCRDDRGGAQVLLYDLTDLTGGGQTANPTAFRKLRPAASKGDVHVSLAHVPAGDYQLTLHQVGDQKNDAYSAWIQMGLPPQLTRDQEQKLRDASTGAPEFTRAINIGRDGHFEQTLPLRENDVLLLSLSPVTHR